MRKLTFPAQEYVTDFYQNPRTLEKTEKAFLKIKGEGLVGIIELLWSGIARSPATDLSRKDHKVIKRLKAALREITRFKDEDEDARIAKEGEQILILEEDQYEIAKKLLDAFKFSSSVSEVVDDLWDIIEKAESFTPAPTLVKDEKKE